MAGPSLELAWGGGVWARRDRRVVEPVVRPALEQVEFALEEIGIGYGEPKTVNVWRCARSEDTWGTARGVSSVDLHIRTDHIKHRKVARFFHELLETTGHELLHTVREEYFPDTGPVERAASEGIAYSGEDFIETITRGPRTGLSIGEAMLCYGTAVNYNALKSRLADLQDYRWPQAMLDDVADDPQRIVWFELNGAAPPAGMLVGVIEVQKRLAEGRSLAELMTWPPEEILDLR
jgi:hypothetical protein